MANYKLTLVCANYDRTSAIIHGLIKPSGFDLNVIEMNDVVRMFSGMFRGEYDASEMSLAELVYYTSKGKNDFVGIPVFPSRVFRHGFMFSNALSKISSPQDLEGKKIGFPRLVQTASVWQRGILVDEFNASPQHTSWHVASLQHWHDDLVKDGIKPRDGSVIHLLEKRGQGDNDCADLALLNGEIDVLGTTRPPSYFIEGDRRVKRLFENYMEVEVSYFRKTKIFPIMHVLVVRRSVAEKYPELPEKLFDLFSKAKKWAYDWMRITPSLSLAWTNRYIEEEEQVFKGDPWAYGLEKNAHVIDKFLSYCYDLGICGRKMEPKELFVPSTWTLSEEP